MVSGLRPDIIIMNCTTPTLYDDLSAALDLKHELPKSRILFFGLHATVRPEDVFFNDGQRTAVDFILNKEFELTARDVCQHILENADLAKVPGLSYVNTDGEIITNIRDSIDNLDFLGFPSRDLLENEKYLLQYNGEPYTIIQISRGCSNSCIYCTATIGSKRVITRSVTSIIDEIMEVKDKYRISNFMFLSDTFTASKTWVMDLCNKIIEQDLNIKWMANSRVDKIDEETATLMRRAGCWIVSLGIESANNNILKIAKKNTTVDQIDKSIKIFKKAGIQIIGYFMFGLPAETKESINRTISFARKSKIDYCYFYIATPYPGTEFFRLAVDNQWLTSKTWNRFFNGDADVIEYPNLTSKELKKSVRRAYFSFYSYPKRIINYLFHIRSAYLLRQYAAISIQLIKKMIH